MELVVTLVLIAIVGAIGSSIFFKREDFDERGFFDQTISAVRYAQKLAVASCSPVRVNVTANTYTLFRANAAGACNNPCTVAATGTNVVSPVDPTRNFTGTAPSGSSLTPNADVVFCPLGNASADVTFSVGSHQFRVWAATGFVEGP